MGRVPIRAAAVKERWVERLRFRRETGSIHVSLWRFIDRFVGPEERHIVSLGEGDTPLVPSVRIGPALGLKRLHFKLDSMLPTGSYKDRWACAAVSWMRQNGQTTAVGTSSGNAGAALSAYCARAGLRCELAIVTEAPEGKLIQMLAHGAHLTRIVDFGSDPEVNERVAAGLARQAERPEVLLAISAYRFNPEAMGAVQSIGYELAEQLDGRVGHVFCQTGGGGLALAVCRAFEQMHASGEIDSVPRVHCVQPAGCPTTAGPIREGLDHAVPCQSTTTVSGLQMGSINDGHDVVRAVRACGGSGQLPTDEEVYLAQRRLAAEEGIFAEPAGATATAGVARAVDEGLLGAEDVVVALVTGVGFKDPASVEGMIAERQVALMTIDEWEAEHL